MDWITPRIAIGHDRFYALKAAGDGDFQPHDERLRGFLEALRVEKHRQEVPRVRAALEGLAFWREHDEAVGEWPDVERWEVFVAEGATWPLLDLLAVVQGLDRDLEELHQEAREARFLVTVESEGAGIFFGGVSCRSALPRAKRGWWRPGAVRPRERAPTGG